MLVPFLFQDEYLADTQNLRVADMKQACKAVGLKVSGELSAQVLWWTPRLSTYTGNGLHAPLSI